MRYSSFQIWLPKVARIVAIVAALVLSVATLPIQASEPESNGAVVAKPTALAATGGFVYLLAAHPVVGKVGQPRTVFLHHPRPNCPPYGVSLDTSAMEASNLVVLRRSGFFICPSVGNPRELSELARFEFVVTPTKVGLLTIRDEIRGVEITIQTLPTAVPSKFDTNGMWFDATTNGSGIALHHRRGTTDAAFGTWFLYSNDGTSRWYSLQSINWQQDGSVLEGLLIQTRGGCAFVNLAGCPAIGSFRTGPPQDLFWVTPPLARITFQSPTRARAEVLTLGGAVLFTSELTKLQF
ncbi:MAG: hypothetical protein LH481_00320 [Burkholderiales bacterium]|nr:hypothetical protein [Burkholderiales bacterium]